MQPISRSFLSLALCSTLLAVTPAQAGITSTLSSWNQQFKRPFVKTFNTLTDTKNYTAENLGWLIAGTVVMSGATYVGLSIRNAYTNAKDEYANTLAFVEDNTNSDEVIIAQLRDTILKTSNETYPLSSYVDNIYSHISYLRIRRFFSFNVAFNQNITNLIARLENITSFIKPLKEYQKERQHRALVSATQMQAHAQVHYNLN